MTAAPTAPTAPNENAETLTQQEKSMLALEDQQPTNSYQQPEFFDPVDGGEKPSQLEAVGLPTDPLLALKDQHTQTPESQGFEGDQNTPVGPVGPKHTQPTLYSTPPPQIAVGDTVLVNATAEWIRQGSDEIHWKAIPKPHRKVPRIPVNCFEGRLFMELTDLSRVLSLSEDGLRAKVQNQQTERISVFEVQHLNILEKKDE